MRKSKFTDSQIMDAMKRVEAGFGLPDICRELGISTRKLPCQVDNLKLEISLTNFLGINSIGATSPRDSCGLNSL